MPVEPRRNDNSQKNVPGTARAQPVLKPADLPLAKNQALERQPRAAGQPLAPEQVARREWLLVAAIVLWGVLLRWWDPGAIAVEHFDEGVYASNLFFGPEQGGQYPARELYAPPGLPLVIEWVSIFALAMGFGLVGVVPCLPALIAGTLMILAAWWAVRTWCGAAGGLACALLIASSDVLALYSRTALTDAPLTLALLSSVFWFERSLSTGRRGYLVASGLAAGAAWWLKYNGWLAIAIPVTASATMWLAGRRATVTGRQVIRSALWHTAIAVVLWLPVLWGLQATGGYAVVAANHAGYVTGWSGWTVAAHAQLEAFVAQSSVSTWLGAWLALLLMIVGIFSKQQFVPSVAQLLVSGLIFGMVMVNRLALEPAASGIVLALLLGATALATTYWLFTSSRIRPSPVLVVVWVCSLGFATPLYNPFPRLILPLAVGGMIAAVLVTSRLILLVWADAAPRPRTSKAVQQSTIACMVMLFLLSAGIQGSVLFRQSGDDPTQRTPFITRLFPSFQDRSGIARVAQTIRTHIEADANPQKLPPVCYVYGEPAVFFHLNAVGFGDCGPVQDLAFPAVSAARSYLVVGSHSLESSTFAQQWQTHGDRFRPIANIAVPLSTIVKLDQTGTGRNIRKLKSQPEKFVLYALK